MPIIIAYASTALVFLVLDMLWLGLVAKDYYRAQMAHLIAPSFHIGAAILFYALYVSGIVYFAVMPALKAGNWQAAIIPGAMLGLVAYGTYDFTNWAVLRDWPVKLTFIDLGWGTVLTALAASFGAAIALRFA